MEKYNFSDLKITTKDMNTEVYLDGNKVNYITGIKIAWDNFGSYANVDISIVASKIEIEADSEIDRFTFIDGKKYKLQEV